MVGPARSPRGRWASRSRLVLWRSGWGSPSHCLKVAQIKSGDLPGVDLSRAGRSPPSGRLRYGVCMCRSIKTLRRPAEPATDEEVHAAALQFVRKVSGYRQPSRANQEAFEAAVDEIAQASRKLLDRVDKATASKPA